MIENPRDWFETKMYELETNSGKEGILLDMKSWVLNSEKSVLVEIARTVSLHQIFEYLNNSTSQEADFLCTIVYEVLSQLTAAELLNRYADNIHNSLAHASDNVKQISLKLLEKCVCEDTVDVLKAKQDRLLIGAVGCLASEERSTAQCAIAVLTKLGSYPAGVGVVFSDLFLAKFQEVMATNDTARFRVYEVVGELSKISPENLSLAKSKGLMKSLVMEIYSSDVLLQLNAFEILSGLATTNHGLHYLLECNVVQELISKLLRINEEPFSFVLLPGLIEFFGNLCVQQPEDFARQHPQVLSLLFDSLTTDDATLLGVIVSTVGKIGSSCSGRTVLMEFNEQMNSFFKRCEKLLTTKNELAISVINSLRELMKKVSGGPGGCNEVTETWLTSMGPTIFDSVLGLAKLPFPEFRVAGFSFLSAIAAHQWGTAKLNNSPGLIEFLLDRSTESNKDCKQAKYEIVNSMVQCPNVEHLLSPDNLKSLQEFVREGPFYVPIEVETATEGAT